MKKKMQTQKLQIIVSQWIYNKTSLPFGKEAKVLATWTNIIKNVKKIRSRIKVHLCIQKKGLEKSKVEKFWKKGLPATNEKVLHQLNITDNDESTTIFISEYVPLACVQKKIT